MNEPIAGPEGAVASPSAPATPSAAPPRAPQARGRGRGDVAARSPELPSLEEHLGLTWLTRIGAGAFLLGALFFFKYAVDSEWIGPTGRVAIGGAAGAVLLVAAEVVREKTKPRFVQSLLGIGLATLFVSVWASAAFYQLIDATEAFVATTVLLLLGAALSLRHRGEPILILALVAGFLNPVILSTGQDRPLELFAYLLLITTATLAVSYRLRFRIVPALAVAGTAALFGGWYVKFFDASVHSAFVAADVAGEAQAAILGTAESAGVAGPYFALSARVVPLVFVGLFAAEWSALGLLFYAAESRARGTPESAPVSSVSSASRSLSREIKGLLLAGLVLAHAGTALLLFDHARLLALVAIGLAGAAIALLRFIRAKELLILPMGAAFIAFLAVSSGVPEAQRMTTVGLLGVWTLVYLLGFLRGLSRPEKIPAGVATSCAVGAALFDGLAAALLMEKRPALFALILAVTSAVVALLASRAERRPLRSVALLATLIALLRTAVHHSDFDFGEGVPSPVVIDWPFLAAAFVFSLVYVGAVLEDTLRRKAKVTWEATITASLSTLGFVATALLGTSTDTPALRALLTAAAGVVCLFTGAALSTAAGKDREPTVLLLGQALGLFATAIAFGLHGAPVTVLWAALSTVAVAIAARTQEKSWLRLGGALFAATVVRLIAVDAASVQASVEKFFATAGREGVMVTPLFWNARSYALAGTGAALLLSAYLLFRDSGARVSFRRAGVIAAVLGYCLLLGLVIAEVHAFAFHPPPEPPYPLDGAEWAAFMKQYEDALHSQRGWMAMSTTLVMATSAALLLGAGFLVRDALHRYLGLCLFLFTVAKLALWDVWNIERIYQIILLTGVGALLVAGGFLYARFGRRLVALMREGGGAPGSAALILLAILSASARAEAAPESRPPLPVSTFKVMRQVVGVDAPGDYSFEVDADLYRASRGEALLGDLRIAGPDGAEVPYVIRELEALRSPRSEPKIEATMLDPSLGSGGSVYATFRLKPRQDHCLAELDLDGDAFLRKVSVETGEDQRSLGLVVEGLYVFRVRQGAAGVVEHLAVPYPRSQAELVRLTLTPEGAGGGVRIRGARFSCPERVDAGRERSVSIHPLAIVETMRDSAAKTTTLTLDAGDKSADSGAASLTGGEGLPIEAILLDVATPEFSRRVDVTATSYRSVWPEAGGGMIYRVKGREAPIELVRVPLAMTRKRWLKLIVHDEDSAPLAIRAASAEVRRRTVTLRATEAGGHVLYAGDKAHAAPRYDLTEILSRGERAAAARPLTLGPVAQNPRFGVEDQRANLPVTERYRAVIGAALSVLLLGLALWALFLLRRPTEPLPPSSKQGD